MFQQAQQTSKSSDRVKHADADNSEWNINPAEMLREQHKVFQRKLNSKQTGDDPVQRLVKEEEEGKPIQGKGLSVNDNPSLEQEADTMGRQAASGQKVMSDINGNSDTQLSEKPTIQKLEQPITRPAPETAIGMEEFIDLVIREEQKYPEEEQRNTSLMITRLRKIFYGAESWDENLIRGVEDIDSPYGEPRERERSRQRVEVGLGFLTNFDMVDTETYPVDPATGQRPEIYQNQEISLPNGDYIDMGHIFAGLDAFNHRHNVSAPLFSYIQIDNVEGTTWVGDLGSVLAEIQFEALRNDGEISENDQQDLINEFASAQDMLGNIDAYAIADSYDIDGSEQKVSDILQDFYLGEGVQAHQSRRYRIFAAGIGLENWNGSGWSNEDDRVEHYTDQVNDAAAMYVGAGADTLNIPSLGGFVLGMAENEGSRVLVQLFFNALREKVIVETSS
jgi:hypothetical protein